jgi:hypothetical protein
MIKLVELDNFFLTFLSAAAVVLFGALYALLFAYSKVSKMPRLMLLAYAAYAVLFVSVITLAKVTNLFGGAFWIALVMTMLVGYLLAPHAIWHLCVGTHAASHHDDPVADKSDQAPAPLNFGSVNTFYQPCKEEAT